MTADLAALLDALEHEALDATACVSTECVLENEMVVKRVQLAALVKVAKAAEWIVLNNDWFPELEEALAALREQLANHEQEER